MKNRIAGKHVRKIALLLLMIMLAVFSFSPIAAAYPPVNIDLSYWYSGSNSIYYWSGSSVSVYALRDCDNIEYLSESDLYAYASYAISQWNNTTGLSMTYGTILNADISVISITPLAANNMGFSSSYIGYTDILGHGTLTAYGNYNGATKYIYRITEPVTIYLIDRSDIYYTDIQWQRLTVHEMGHALGYIGHYSYANVMKADVTNIVYTIPNIYEYRHLHQVY